MTLPILYSFRRCPYAMRARLALAYAGQQCELREVVLRDKPPELLQASPKGTVPVIVLPDGRVLEESYDIVKWALGQNDPRSWSRVFPETDELVAQNDGPFKAALDKYKYASRHPEQPPGSYRREGEKFLAQLEKKLSENQTRAGQAYLLGSEQTVADIVIFPFIRQFAFVDEVWFFSSPYKALQNWLQWHLDSPLFAAVMHKYPQWQPGANPVIFPSPSIPGQNPNQNSGQNSGQSSS